MNTLHQRKLILDDRRLVWSTMGLALVAAFCYVLIQRGLLAVGDLQPSEQPAAIIYIAAAGYVVGGLLILTRQRWLWITGAVINALVMLFFVLGYLHRPAVLFSPGGLTTKIAQLLLEVGLLTLIVRGWQHIQSKMT